MNPTSRIGRADAEIVLLHKGGRNLRLDLLERGEEAPREFFYGYFDLQQAGFRVAMLSSAGAVAGLAGRLADGLERSFANLTGLGVRPLSMRLAARQLANAKVVISYTDGFSLSMGLGFPHGRQRPALIGGFHGLSDIEARAPNFARPGVRSLITRSLKGLDHAFFFGPGDRQYAIEHYALEPERSSIYPFGIDTEFWRPVPGDSVGAVVAVGQDLNRDYQLLAVAPGGHPIWIVTRQRVRIPPNAGHIKILAGDFFGSDSPTDADLRRLYCSASAVVVPLKDVHQPSGYSVTLQAMSCARPVILSNIKGLWSPLLKDGKNCILVPPGNANALGDAIARVRTNPDWASRIGVAARETALAHFNLSKIAGGTKALAQRGFDIHAGMLSRAA